MLIFLDNKKWYEALLDILIFLSAIALVFVSFVYPLIVTKSRLDEREANINTKAEEQVAVFDKKAPTELITYSSGGHFVGLTYQPGGPIGLRLLCHEIIANGGKECLEFLKSEVNRLTAKAGATTRLEKLSEYSESFHLTGGHPLWKPFTTAEKSGTYVYLIFADKASVSGNTISAEGGESQNSSYSQ